MDKAEGFGLSIDFLAGHGDFEGGLGGVETTVHDANGAYGNHAKNSNSKHDFNEGVATEKE